MLSLIAFAVLLAFGQAAQAKVAPDDAVLTTPSAAANDAVMYSGPIGAMLEANYFRTPRVVSTGNSLCRLHLYFSSEPFRLARSCD